MNGGRAARLISAMGTAVAAGVLTTIVGLTSGCGNDDDEHLWGDSLSPTQMQKAKMGTGPMTVMDPGDGDNEDPFISSPNYPFVEEPWWDEPGYSGG